MNMFRISAIALTLLVAAPAFAESPSPSENIPSENLGAVGNTNATLTPVPRGADNRFERAEGTLDQQRAINAKKAGTLPVESNVDGRGYTSHPTDNRANPAWNSVDGKADSADAMK